MSASEISAPRWRFLDGLCKTQGYNVVTEGERVTVAFEPWALEQADPFDIPCLRLEFRHVDGRPKDADEAERFLDPEDGIAPPKESRTTDIGGARPRGVPVANGFDHRVGDARPLLP